jgi:hypothetical protein
MGNVSRPLIGLLVAVVAFFALWLVALKPSSSSTSGGVPSHALNSAIDRAKGVQAVVNHAAAAAGGTPGATAAAHAHPAAAHSAAVASKPTSKPAATAKARVSQRGGAKHAATTPVTAAQRVGVVQRALAAHDVLAALFYNPAASDDRAVKQELQSIPTHSGKVVRLTVPLSELSSYSLITNQVPVEFSPTLVVINRKGQASTIVGFADTFEIAQRIAGAL